MKWISVKNRLPSNDETVLIISDRYYPSSAVFCKATDSKGATHNVWFDAHDSNAEYYDITHWSVLPKPPKLCASYNVIKPQKKPTQPI
jgi:hypothetical protein